MKSILFYSFKGGVGRTQALLNIAKYLASESEEKKKILIVDFDIYAPGITYLANFGKDENEEYLISFLLSIFSGKKSKLYTEKYSENITIVPAYNINAVRSYNAKLSELSQYLYSLKTAADERNENINTIADIVFKYIIESINRLEEKYDYVFFDARTGITEVSDILFSNFLDLKVLISSFNKQNIQGTNDILELLSLQKGPKHKILRVLSPKPLDAKRELYKEISSQANLELTEKERQLKKEFNWIGTYNISYEKEIVTNDVNAWEILDDSSQYRKNIVTIANIIIDTFEGNKRIEDIIGSDENKMKTDLDKILQRLNND